MSRSIELGILTASYDYHRLLDDTGSESSNESRFNDLDLFFALCYRYYLGKGYMQILINHIIDLLNVTFFVFFTSFLFVGIDYHELLSINNKTAFKDVVQMDRLMNPKPFIVMYWFVFLGYFSYKTLFKLYYDGRNLKKIQKFYHEKLGISDFDLSSISWNHIVSKMKEQHFQIQGELTPYLVANLIMRKDNYFICLINDQIIDPTICGFGYMTKLLEWHIRHIIDTNLYDKNRQVDMETLREHQTDYIWWTCILYGVLHLIFMPFIGFGAVMYFLFKYGEQFYNNPNYLFNRSWSPMAKWRFREFNELDHIFHERIHLSSEHTQNYLDQFTRMITTHVANFCSFIISSCIFVLILFSILNEQLIMNLEITPGQTVLWWTGILGTILAGCRAFIRHTRTPRPYKHMKKISEYIHYIPEDWEKNAHTYRVLEEIRSLFQFHGVLILKEIFGVIFIPFILWFNIAPNSKRIVDHILDNTVDIPDIGKVCKSAQFDKNQDLSQSANLDKLAKSQIHFKKEFPEWGDDALSSDLMV